MTNKNSNDDNISFVQPVKNETDKEVSMPKPPEIQYITETFSINVDDLNTDDIDK